MLNAPLQVPAWAWFAYIVFVLAVLTIDLFAAGHRGTSPSRRSALAWSACWIGLAAAFGGGLLFWPAAGPAVATKFAAGYVLELSLSVDNLFVFMLVFSRYQVPHAYRHKALFWGILGALVLRALFIGAGAAMISRWHWMLYVFGAFLLYTGVKLLFGGDAKETSHPGVDLIHRWLPVAPRFDGDRFFTVVDGKTYATMLLVVVLVIEIADVVFALDSIPAVFGVTTDPFIVYTSNIFAILGLRSMFFALEGAMQSFKHLKTGLAVILALIGLKLLFLHFLETTFGFSGGEFLTLGLIAATLLVSVLASLQRP